MTFTPPVIGITSYGRNEKDEFMLPAVYVDSVRRAGGIPLLIPPGEPHQEALLDRLDGIIISGGGDIDPALYNGQNHETIYRIDPERDSSEIPLVRLMVESDLPTLCICRGIQVLNVALGGTLIEHVPDEVGEELTHRAPLDPETGNPYSDPAEHPVHLQPDSRLAEIIGQAEVVPVSWHHQALRQLAPNLKVVAEAADGIIEAVELPDHPWLMGVQWHPEMSAAKDPSQQRLFDAFVKAAAAQTVNRKS